MWYGGRAMTQTQLESIAQRNERAREEIRKVIRALGSAWSAIRHDYGMPSELARELNSAESSLHSAMATIPVVVR